jgi:glucosamine-6-phosphate deaminase
VDLAVLGIGENAHLAFNDPPADFDTTDAYVVVSLDEACRRQQVGEGWFARLEDVPATAVTMSIRQMLSAREIVVIVPDERKAAAVKATLESPVDPKVPASILRTHENVTLFLDAASASAVDRGQLKTYVSIP